LSDFALDVQLYDETPDDWADGAEVILAYIDNDYPQAKKLVADYSDQNVLFRHLFGLMALIESFQGAEAQDGPAVVDDKLVRLSYVLDPDGLDLVTSVTRYPRTGRGRELFTNGELTNHTFAAGAAAMATVNPPMHAGDVMVIPALRSILAAR
jgi:hypothetical protein